MSVHKYGFRKSLPMPHDKQYAQHHGKFALGAPLPESFNLAEYCPNAYNQLDLGSCTANAGAAAIEILMRIQGERVVTPSRLFLYYNERAIDGDVGQDGGSTLRTCIQSVNQNGVCDEQYWPYIVENFAQRPPNQAYTQARQHQGVKSFVVAQSEYDIKHCLAVAKRPILFGMQVYDSFESQQVANTGVMPMPTPNSQCLGGHAILIIGYLKDYFIVRNSWGTDWGCDANGGHNSSLRGYFLCPKEFLLNPAYCSDFWCLEQIV